MAPWQNERTASAYQRNLTKIDFAAFLIRNDLFHGHCAFGFLGRRFLFLNTVIVRRRHELPIKQKTVKALTVSLPSKRICE